MKRGQKSRGIWIKIEKFFLLEAKELVEIDFMKRGQKSKEVIDFKSKNSYFMKQLENW